MSSSSTLLHAMPIIPMECMFKMSHRQETTKIILNAAKKKGQSGCTNATRKCNSKMLDLCSSNLSCTHAILHSDKMCHNKLAVEHI